MSSKLGLILSMLFVAMFFAFAGDMVSLQFAYTHLDSISVTIGKLISEEKTINQTFINNVEQEFDIDFILLNEEEPLFGDVVNYVIVKDFKPMIISSESITLSIQRSSVIGYYK